MQNNLNPSNGELKVTSYFDALKKNNCPRIEVVNPVNGRESLIFDPAQKSSYFEKSYETGLAVRYCALLSDGRIVSVDGALRLCVPDVWQSLSLTRKLNSVMAKRIAAIQYLFSYKEIAAIAQELAESLYASGFTSETYNVNKLSKELDKDGHLLGGLINFELSTTDKKKVSINSIIFSHLEYLARKDFYLANKEKIDELRKLIGVSSQSLLEKEPAAINQLVLEIYRRQDIKDLHFIPLQDLIALIHLRIEEVIAFRNNNQITVPC